MTKLSYKVGEFEIASYPEAMELAKKTGCPIEKIYTPVIENLKVNPVTIEKRAAAIKSGKTRHRAL